MKLVATAIDITGKMVGMLFKTLELISGKKKKPDLSALWVLFGPPGMPQFSVMYQIAESASTSIALILNKIITATAGIKNMASAKAGMELVAMAIKAVGDFASTLINIMKMVMPKGGGAEKMKKALPTVLDIMSQLTAKIALSLPKAINPILKIAQGIPDPKGTKAGMDIVAAAIGAVGDFAGAIKDVMSIIPDVKGQTHETKLLAVTTAVSSISNVIKTKMPEVIGSLEKSIKLVKKNKIRSKDVKIIATMMEAVGSFATAMKDIMGIMPEPPKDGKGQAVKTKSLMEYVTEIAAAASSGMEKLITGLMTVLNNKEIGSVYKKRHSLKALGVMFKALGEFATAVSAMQGLGGGKGLDGLKEMMPKLGALFDDGPAAKAISSIISFTAGLSPKDIKKSQANMKRFASAVTKSIVPAMDAFSSMDTITEEKVRAIGSGVTEAVQWFEDLKDSKVEGTVELAKILAKPGKNTIKVETKTPQINATFKVYISGEQLSEAVAAHGGTVATGDGTK